MLQRRNDREEIRRRLAMGEEADKPGGRKPSLQSRLQSGECRMIYGTVDFEYFLFIWAVNNFLVFLMETPRLI